jgi:hypothetical protein
MSLIIDLCFPDSVNVICEDETTLEHLRDCSGSGDCEPACRYVLDHCSPEFRIVKKINGKYQNVGASPEDKRSICEQIYFESETDFSDEDNADLYLVWEAARDIETIEQLEDDEDED